LQQRVRIDLFVAGMGFSFAQNLFQAAQHLLEHGDRSGVGGVGHGFFLK